MNYLMDLQIQYKDSIELNQALSQKYEDKGLIKLRYEHLLSALEA